MKALLFSLILFYSGLLAAQSAELDLQKALSVFTESPHLYYEATLYYFDDYAMAPSDSLACTYQRHDQQLYARFGAMELLNSGNILLVADHESKAVSVSQRDDKQQLPFQVFDEKQLLGMLHDRGAKVGYVSAPEGYRAIEVVSTEAGAERAVFRYRADNWLLQEVRITAAGPLFDPLAERLGKSTVVVRYATVDTTPRRFSYKPGQFVSKGKRGYQGSGKCAGYQVL